MAKLNIERTEDSRGINCIKISKKKGKLNEREVFEALEYDFQGYIFIHLVEITEEVPLDYYDNEGDYWLLYEPYDIVPPLAQFAGIEVKE